MTAAAMFGHPDFFKVGISESGNHDNAIYNRWWSEEHDGVKENVDEEGDVTFESDIDYVFWRRVDYFSQHLLGSAPDAVDITEIQRERQIRR